MSYKLKSHSHRYSGKYWQERELGNIREKYKGKIPPFVVLASESERMIEEEPQRTHRRNRMVYYKGKLAVVQKTSQKGVWIKKLGKNDDKGVIEGEVSKPIFVPEKKAEKELRAVYPKVPAYFNPPFLYG